MEFLIKRTTANKWLDIDSPNAKIEELMAIDKNKWNYIIKFYDEIDRWTLTPKQYNKIQHEDWFAQGINHKKTKNEIERTFKDNKKGMFININTLETLADFVSDYGRIILSNSDYDEIPTIEIYDTYRE